MKNYFEGWYFKCQSKEQSFAIIPAIHISGKQRSASIQLITQDHVLQAEFPFDTCSCYPTPRKQKGTSSETLLQIGDHTFGTNGMSFSLDSPDSPVSGNFQFGALTPLSYDIMGPFAFVPFLECRHSVLSLRHTVSGELCMHGTVYQFRDAIGYLEGDRGSSFPREYAWTHCFFEEGSLMLSVARIPLGAFCFTGVIGVILWRGKEYRLATYLGAKAIKIQNGEIVIRQKNTVLFVHLKHPHTNPLLAPVKGSMNRTIRESLKGIAAYRLEQNGNVLFEFESPDASFEYEYP